ncbi:MAG: polysaccharide biosynthesis tyrosine autokinase [Coxiellaceae bacterium]|nr:polysaccharide biosynthesis tyrosine autokinase [Coxiellaceae bacterium]
MTNEKQENGRGYPDYTPDKNINFVEFDIKRLLIELLVNKWRVLMVVMFFFAIAVLYSFTLRPSYQSSVLLKVDASSSSAMSVAGSLSNILGRMPFFGRGGGSPEAFEKTLIQSRFILGHVIEKLHLNIMSQPRYFPLFGRIIARNYKGNGVASSLWGFTGYAWGGQSIKVDKLETNSDYINRRLKLVSEVGGYYSLYDMRSSEKILRGKVGEVVTSSDGNPAVTIQVKSLNASPGNVFYVRNIDIDRVIAGLGKSLKIFDPGLDGGDSNKAGRTSILKITYRSGSPKLTVSLLNTLAESAYTSGVLRLSDQANQTLRFLNKRISKVYKELQGAESNLAKYQAISGNLNIGQKFTFLLKELAGRQASLEGLNLQRTEKLQKYTASHPYIVSLDKKIAEVKKGVLKLESTLHNLPVSDQKSVELLRNVKVKNELYLMLLNRQQELNILKAGARSNIRILGYASEPPLKILRSKLPIWLFGIFSGLFLSFSYLVFRIFTDNKLSDIESIEQNTGVGVTAIIPFSDKQKSITEHLKESKLVEASMLLSEASVNDVVVESLRSFRTNIQLNLLENDCKVMSICSLTPGVGKSFLSANMAYLLAEQGVKVLLLDADLRKGYLNKYIKTTKHPGLSDVLLGEASLDSTIVKYGNTSLDFIPRGKSTALTANLLSSSAFGSAIDRLKDMYDYVVVDTAPVLLLTDGILAAKQCDKNFMVLASGEHTASELKAGLAKFKMAGLQMPETLFNFYSSHKKQEYSYYKYKYYGYTYKDDGYYEDSAKGDA